MSSSLIGRTLGKSKIIEKLGQGGMATVYIGYQEDVDRRVAIKVLPPHPGLDAQFIERFRLEARTIARLQHPHILPLYDYGTEDDIVYLVMAYVEGGTLDDLIIDAPLPLPTVEKVLREVASALDYAHRQGVIHRDIKPGNILLDSEGHALLADFGIVKLSEGGTNLTGSAVIGTPAYMAPEQAQGLAVDARTDVYALGAVAYQMLTGQQPFTAETTMQLMLKVMQEPAPNVLDIVDGLPGTVGNVIERVLAKDPNERYQTATEFAEAFSRAVRGETGLPVEPKAVIPKETAPQIATTAAGVQTKIPTDNQTVIVQQGISPWVLLGGFAIIAVALVIVVLLVVSNVGDEGAADEDTPQPSATQVAAAGVSETPGTVATDVPTEPTVQTFGRVGYSTIDAPGDSVSVRVENLQPPGAGQMYVAWLANTVDGTRLNLGNLVVDAFGDGALSFTDPEGRMLPAHYNAILVSVEQSGFAGENLAGEVRYSGSVPAEIPAMLAEVFVTSDGGLNGGSLLAGTETEASIAAQHAGMAAGSSNLAGVQTHSEHVVNILKGETVDYNGNGRGENPGRGVGVYAFINRIDEKLNAVLNMPGVSVALQSNAEFMRVCLENTRIRADRIVELQLEQIAADDLETIGAQLTESFALASELLSGFDLNQNGQVDPFEGECGLDQMQTYGILIGNMDVVAGPLAGD